MSSLWGAFSSKNPPLKGKCKSSNDISSHSNTEEQKKQLTRSKKLRHVTDDEIGLNSTSTDISRTDQSQSWPVSPISGPCVRILPHVVARHWSKSAVPQPLPLPGVNSQPSKPNESCRDFSVNRNPSPQVLGNTTAPVVERSCISPTNHNRAFHRELNVETARNDFSLHFPTKSAPTSGYSSPVLSPQRYSTVDFFHQSFQGSSNKKGSMSDRLSTSWHAPLLPTPDRSPLHSPLLQSPPVNANTKQCNEVFFQFQDKSLPESCAAWLDNNNTNGHPLPRPPTVSRISPSPRYSIDRSDTASVRGQWQRGRPIGRGTYGTVYIATHRETGATCAVKEVEMIPDDPKCAECIKQLEQEIKFLKELRHPNIVEYYGCEIIEDRFCIYLEYVHPGSISKYVNEHCGAMTESIVRNFTRHILSGLAYLHSTKTIHRDVKGANLLVNASGVVKLADFGLAKHLVGNDIDLSLKGTPHWISPEVLQAVMRKDANPNLAYGVDIWSVGCTVIEMFTGKPPWSELDGVKAMFSILTKAPPIPEALSAEGKDFLQRCFQRNPEDRPSANKLLEHPFLRSSHDHGSKLTDLRFSGEWTRQSRDVMPLSSVTMLQDRKLSHNDRSRHTSPEHVYSRVTPHHSPRSTLEDLPCTFLPELDRCSNTSSPSNVQNNLFSKATNINNSPFHAGEIPLIRHLNKWQKE